MSAAFDTIDHDVLVTRLVQRFGVTGCAIAWIKSYLADRSQAMNINGGVSNDTPLAFGVPQGSALVRTYTVFDLYYPHRGYNKTSSVKVSSLRR